jgi:hypothetical protein
MANRHSERIIRQKKQARILGPYIDFDENFQTGTGMLLQSLNFKPNCVFEHGVCRERSDSYVTDNRAS